MKMPKAPTKPYPPYKPNPPPEKLEQNKNIGSFSLENYGTYSFLEFRNLLLNFCQEHKVNIDDVRFELEIEKDWCYDDVTCSLKANVFTTSIIDNPQYKTAKKKYDADLDKYHEDMAKYKELETKYTADLKQYKKDYDIYMLEYNKNEVKRLEKKVAKGKV